MLVVKNAGFLETATSCCILISMKFNKHSLGLCVAAICALWNAIWAIIVGAGAGQKFMDSMSQMHFLSNPYKVQAFSFGGAVSLVIAGAICGYVTGWIFAWIWGEIAKRS
jgi:hypothetical protein